MNVNSETFLIVFVALTGAAVLLQACVLLALYLTVRKSAKMFQDQISDIRTTALPAIKEGREFFARVGPQIESVVTDLAAVSQSLHRQTAELQTSSIEIMDRVRRQSSRVDQMVSGALDTVDRATAVMTDLVNVPLRQISGVAAFAKAALGSLRMGNTRRGPEPQATHSPADKDLFV